MVDSDFLLKIYLFLIRVDAGRFAASLSLRIPAPSVSKCGRLQSPLKARKIQTRFA